MSVAMSSDLIFQCAIVTDDYHTLRIKYILYSLSDSISLHSPRRLGQQRGLVGLSDTMLRRVQRNYSNAEKYCR